jgi:hypothetical protein
LLPQLQADIPDPLREDLPELLATRRVGDPAVAILFLIFLGEHSFKGTSMQVEMKHIRGRKGLWWHGAQEDLANQSVFGDANSGRSGSDRVGGNDHTHTRSGWGKWNIHEIEKSTRGSTLWMCRNLVRGL